MTTLTHVTHFSFIACVLTDTDEVIPGLDASAFVLTRVWCTPVKSNVFGFCLLRNCKCTLKPTVPVSDATGAQQQLSVTSPLSLQNNVDIELFVVYEDVLHAAVEVVQLGLTFPYCVISLRTTWTRESKRVSGTAHIRNIR